VLAEPGLLAELRAASLSVPLASTAASTALFDLLDQTEPEGATLSAGGVIEALRLRGHEAVVQRLLPAVQDLQGFSREELKVEVRQFVQDIEARARRTEASRALAGVSSAAELSEDARALVVQTLTGTRTVEEQ
jgi:hypothetical protein